MWFYIGKQFLKSMKSGYQLLIFNSFACLPNCQWLIIIIATVWSVGKHLKNRSEWMLLKLNDIYRFIIWYIQYIVLYFRHQLSQPLTVYSSNMYRIGSHIYLDLRIFKFPVYGKYKFFFFLLLMISNAS